MATYTEAWGDGSGDSLTVNPNAGNGDGTIAISSATNEYCDRSKTIKVSVGNINRTITVSQSGRREQLNASDGEFTSFDNHTINVIK